MAKVLGMNLQVPHRLLSGCPPPTPPTVDTVLGGSGTFRRSDLTVDGCAQPWLPIPTCVLFPGQSHVNSYYDTLSPPKGAGHVPP